MKTPNYKRMTDLELAADLERWASVRDRISLRRQHGEGYGGSLGSGNLLEAAKRLRGDHQHIGSGACDEDILQEINDCDVQEGIKNCPTCQKIERELLEEYNERVS